MRYSLQLDFNTKNSSQILKIFELEAGEKDRSRIDIQRGQDKITFKIEAIDATALKASTNLVLKILTIFEKSEAMI